MNRHIVKVKAPRAGSSAERLELVLDPHWNPSPNNDDEDARDDNEDEAPYPELTQSWSRHSYHSESTAETDNRSLSKSSLLASMQRTYSLESDGSYFSRTDFESDALNKEMERRGHHHNNGVSESIDEEDELYYGDVEEEHACLDDSDENKNGLLQGKNNEYYTNLEKDVSALQSGLMLQEKEEELHVQNPDSRSYEDEEDTQQYHVNDDACVITDVSSPEEEEEYRIVGGDMSATFDDDDQQLQGAMSPESDVYDEVSENVYDEVSETTPANNSKTTPPFKRGVSFDEESLSRQESTRSQDRSKTPLRRMPSEDTSVTSVGYRVTTTVKQNMAPPPSIIKQRALSPSILREPKYASSAISVASRGKENTPRRKKILGQEPKSILSPRGANNNNNTALEQPKALSPTNDSIASPDVASVHSHGSNVAVGRGLRQNDQRRQLQQQQQQQQQKREAERQQRLRQLAENKERLHQQQVEQEQERLRRQKEQEKKQRLQQQQLAEEEQYREPLQSIDPIEREQDDDPWFQYNAIPKLTRSPSGLSRFSEGVRSTVALDGFSRDNKPQMPKLSWFRSKNKQSVPITTAANEAARPNGKTRLMKKFFGKKKKGNTTDLDDSEMARDSEIGRHPLSSRDPYPEHDQAPLPQILTSDRPMRVHTAGRDWDNESVENHSVYSHHSKQPVRSHNSCQWVESSRHDGNPVPIRRKDSQQPQINNETTMKRQSKSDHLKSNPWSGKANDKTAGSSSIIVHDSTATGSAPTNQSPDGAYNIDGAGMPSFKWWTWSQPDEAGEQKDSRYCAMMCVFPPAADE
jgi:hypothetical protein